MSTVPESLQQKGLPPLPKLNWLIYLWEHRAMPHRRRITCHLIGDIKTTTKAAANTSTNLIPEAWAEDGGVDTEVDLLIDRLHDIADDPP